MPHKALLSLLLVVVLVVTPGCLGVHGGPPPATDVGGNHLAPTQHTPAQGHLLNTSVSERGLCCYAEGREPILSLLCDVQKITLETHRANSEGNNDSNYIMTKDGSKCVQEITCQPVI